MRETPSDRAIARDCLAACERLGAYRFKACLGESQHYVQDHWVCAEEIGTWLDELPHEANSGDVYAVLVDACHSDPTSRQRFYFPTCESSTTGLRP